MRPVAGWPVIRVTGPVSNPFPQAAREISQTVAAALPQVGVGVEVAGAVVGVELGGTDVGVVVGDIGVADGGTEVGVAVNG